MILEDKVFKVTIKGDVWHIYIVPEHDNTTVDEDSSAETNFELKEMYFKHHTLRIIRHEVLHAYIGYTYTETASLSPLQQEELFCELYAHEHDNMEITVQTIQKLIKEVK